MDYLENQLKNTFISHPTNVVNTGPSLSSGFVNKDTISMIQEENPS